MLCETRPLTGNNLQSNLAAQISDDCFSFAWAWMWRAPSSKRVFPDGRGKGCVPQPQIVPGAFAISFFNILSETKSLRSNGTRASVKVACHMALLHSSHAQTFTNCKNVCTKIPKDVKTGLDTAVVLNMLIEYAVLKLIGDRSGRPGHAGREEK